MEVLTRRRAIGMRLIPNVTTVHVDAPAAVIHRRGG